MVSASSGYPKFAMVQQSLLDETAAPLIPERPSLTKLREAAAGCKACPLWKTGTQTVFGEGSPKAEVMFVGEQPGDQEDKVGKPFVGPAGRVLDQAMEQAGIDRSLAYVTNVVKPRVLVCLGATAAQALLGRQFRVTRQRGEPVESELAPVVLATVHPSSILRADEEDRETELAAFVSDLKVVGSHL